MRLFKAVAVTSVLVTALTGTAHAEEFNGPFVGVQAGWNSDKVANLDTPLGAVPMDDDYQSFTGGVYAGYDHLVADPFVVGVEGSFDVTSDDKLWKSSNTHAFTLDPKYAFDLTARTGYLVTPETLIYVRGGYTNVRIKTTLADSVGPVSESGHQDGWLVGGGAERQLTSNVSARLEYRYSDLSEGAGTYDRHRVLTGISYRF